MNNNNTIVGHINLVGVEEETLESNSSFDSVDLLPSAEEILNVMVNEDKNKNNDDEILNDPDFEPSDDEPSDDDSSDEDTVIEDYLSDDENFETDLVDNNCEDYSIILKNLVQKYHRVNDLIIRRKKVLRLRHGYAFTYYNHDLERVYATDLVLTRAKQWLEILKKRFVVQLEHFNDALLYNLTFNDCYATPLIINSKHQQKNFRHRIINFLSRCRTKKYKIDRIVSFVTLLLSSYRVLKAGMLNPEINMDEHNNENENPNIIVLD